MTVNQELERFVGKSNPPIGANGHAQKKSGAMLDRKEKYKIFSTSFNPED